jgi:AcrR family transcriptional regulator
MTTRIKQIRDATATKERILTAAKIEFAGKGLAGARVDAIAARANANKRMIYHYFQNKESLFTAVLEQAYLDIRFAEQKLLLDHLDPGEALETFVRFTWQYYIDHPEFITLVNSANLHQARHLEESEQVRLSSRQLVNMIRSILDRGASSKIFRAGIDPVHLNITIAAIGYYYLTNRYTGTILFERDLMSEQALEERLAFNIDTIMQSVLA